MTVLNLFMILISFALLVLCMLAPLKKSTAAQEHPALKMLLIPHAVYGVLLLIVSFVHGILSGNKPAMMSGKAAWLCLLILLLMSLFKKRMVPGAWLRLHRIFAFFFCVLIVIHIVSSRFL